MPNPEENKYAPTTWVGEIFTDLQVPCGQMCQVRRPGVEGLVRVGILNEVDGITSMVDDKHIKRVKGQKSVDVKSLQNDPQALVRALKTIDRVVEYVVIQPSIKRAIKMVSDDETGEVTEVHLPEEEMVPGQIYTSMVSIEDRMFIYQYAVGGSKDLEKFRSKIEQSAGSLEA